MTVLQGYKTIILDDGFYLLSFPQNKQMKLIPVLTLYMQNIYKGGLAAEPVLYCIYNMPNFIKNVQFLREIFIRIVYTAHLLFSSAQINPAASNLAFQ